MFPQREKKVFKNAFRNQICLEGYSGYCFDIRPGPTVSLVSILSRDARYQIIK